MSTHGKTVTPFTNFDTATADNLDAFPSCKRPKGKHEGMSGNRYRIRMWCLLLVHVYIVLHFVTWYIFDLEIWAKTAMMGTPSLISGNINTAALMVAVIIIVVPFLGRKFCGWICHMRGAIEFADWTMRKFGVRRYVHLKNRNTLLNFRYRWLFRTGALFVLLLPALILVVHNGYNPKMDLTSPPPYADLPGYENLLFRNTSKPFNFGGGFKFENIKLEIVTKSAVHNQDPTEGSDRFSVFDLSVAFAFGLFIIFCMSFVMQYFWGHGAFCRILCPYVMIMVPLMNLNPWQKRITRINQCTGCRSCSNACPQGIDVSREIFHFDGKVTSRECIKCYACIDACEHGVLKDTGKPAVPQTVRRKEYEKKPWENYWDGKKVNTLQILEPLGPVNDFASMIVALGGGWLFSQLGGFYFYVGSIIGFAGYRLAWHLMITQVIGKQIQSPIKGKDSALHQRKETSEVS